MYLYLTYSLLFKVNPISIYESLNNVLELVFLLEECHNNWKLKELNEQNTVSGIEWKTLPQLSVSWSPNRKNLFDNVLHTCMRVKWLCAPPCSTSSLDHKDRCWYQDPMEQQKHGNHHCAFFLPWCPLWTVWKLWCKPWKWLQAPQQRGGEKPKKIILNDCDIL